MTTEELRRLGLLKSALVLRPERDLRLIIHELSNKLNILWLEREKRRLEEIREAVSELNVEE